MDEHSLDAAVKSNFSGRGNSKAESETLRNDIMKVLLQMGEEQRKTLGGFGRSLIEKSYSVTRMVQDNIEVYKQLLEQK